MNSDRILTQAYYQAVLVELLEVRKQLDNITRRLLEDEEPPKTFLSGVKRNANAVAVACMKEGITDYKEVHKFAEAHCGTRIPIRRIQKHLSRLRQEQEFPPLEVELKDDIYQSIFGEDLFR